MHPGCYNCVNDRFRLGLNKFKDAMADIIQRLFQISIR